jgi:transcriptional regulator with XRE-family HTH domain
VEDDQSARVEDLAQLIIRIKDTYRVSGSEIARRIDVRAATVSAWVNRTRGNVRGPNRETLRRLAHEFPKFTEAEIFAAAGRKTPGPLSPEAEERIQELYRELTAEQQAIVETQMRALTEMNKSAQ